MKAGRKRSGRTILQKMLIPVTAIVLAQAALYAVVFLQGGVLSHTDANAYDILGERTINRQLYQCSCCLRTFCNSSSGVSPTIS